MCKEVNFYINSHVCLYTMHACMNEMYVCMKEYVFVCFNKKKNGS